MNTATLRAGDGHAPATHDAPVPVGMSAPREAHAAHKPESLSIGARGLAKRYGSFTALDDVSLDVGAGEFL
ncbi:MAG: hypothetical protein EOP39_28895, partial [Rubrivivax sp.]